MVTFIESLLDGRSMEIHGDGLQTRSFTFVSDTVDGIFRALTTPEARGEIVNVGSTESISILDLAERVQTALGVSLPLRATFVPYETLPGNYQDVRHRIPDTRKARELLGFEAKVRLEEGLAVSIEWHDSKRIEQEPAVFA